MSDARAKIMTFVSGHEAMKNLSTLQEELSGVSETAYKAPIELAMNGELSTSACGGLSVHPSRNDLL